MIWHNGAVRRRVLFAALLVPSFVACGLSVTGVAPTADGGAPDGGAGTDAPLGTDAPSLEDGAPGTGTDAAGTDAADASSVDAAAPDSGAYAKCLSACKGPDAIGCTDDGTCVVGGVDSSKVVTCPGGVPCRVDCKNPNDCAQGVDCGGATSCTVNCTGDNTCVSNGVKCGGTSCDITCTGANACANGASCTASDHCGITCVGNGACQNVIPTCNAAKGDCSITCGQLPNSQPNACLNGASCTALTKCTVSCLGSMSCVNNAPTAKAADVVVTCADGENCKNGVKATATTSATISCGTGNACAGDISCHSPSCTGTCKASGVELCYQGPNVVANGCNQQSGFSGCP